MMGAVPVGTLPVEPKPTGLPAAEMNLRRLVSALKSINSVANQSSEIQPFLAYDGPIFLEENVFIGPHCFLRGPLYIGKNTRIGPYCEIKRSVIMNNSFIAHQNIIPDSVIGSNVWLAGGVMITNLRLDKQPVKVTCNGIEKSADRFGLFIEDNSTLGVRVTVMPGTHVRAETTVLGPSTIKGVV